MNKDQKEAVQIKTAMPSSRSQNFSVAFKEQLEEDEDLFREKLSLPITAAVGLHNWALLFKRRSNKERDYQVDVYTDHPKHYKIIEAIIREKISDIKLQLVFKGAVSAYAGNGQ